MGIASRVGLAVSLLVALVACTESPTVTRLPEGTASTPAAQPTVQTTADLPALKKSAGIPDCPESDGSVPPLSGGLPDVVVPCLGGGRDVRLAGLRGKPMMINLWAQWCEPCRAESPYLRQFEKAAKGKVLLLGVNYDDPRPELAVEFASAVGWTYPQMADPERRLSGAMPISGIPLTLFVDADGKVVHKVSGGLDSYEELVQFTRDELGVKL